MTDEASDLDLIFAGSVGRERERLKLSKSELARRMQDLGWETYSQMTVTRTENNERKVGVAEAHALAEALMIPYTDLTRYGREAELHKMTSGFQRQLVQLGGSLGVALNLQEELARHLDNLDGSVPAGSEENVNRVLDWTVVHFLLNELRDRRQALDERLELEPDDVGRWLDYVRDHLDDQLFALYRVVDSERQADGLDQEA